MQSTAPDQNIWRMLRPDAQITPIWSVGVTVTLSCSSHPVGVNTRLWRPRATPTMMWRRLQGRQKTLTAQVKAVRKPTLTSILLKNWKPNNNHCSGGRHRHCGDTAQRRLRPGQTRLTPGQSRLTPESMRLRRGQRRLRPGQKNGRCPAKTQTYCAGVTR